MHEQLVARGFAGRLFPVNPRYEEIRGLPAYPGLAQLPEAPDLVVVATPAPTVVEVIESAAALGVGAAVVLASGFAEEGPEGAARQQRLTEVARSAGIALCGPNCYGVIDLLDSVSAASLPLPEQLVAGELALLTQSGALSHGVVDFLVRRGVGLGYLITAGNEAVLDLADYLGALADDDRVRSVALYVEAVRRPRAFLDAVELLIGRGRSVAVLKSGRSDAGQRATAAHTGAVADDERVWSALLAGAGAVQVQDLADLVESATYALAPVAATPTRPYLMSFSGAAAAVMADLAADAGLELEQPDPDLAAALAEALPEAVSIANPLDLTGFVADRLERLGVIAKVIADEGGGQLPVMVLNSPSGTTTADRDLYLGAAAVLEAAGVPAALGAMLPGDVDPGLLAVTRRMQTPVVAGMRTIANVFAARQRAEWGRADLDRAAAAVTAAGAVALTRAGGDGSAGAAAAGAHLAAAVDAALEGSGAGVLGEDRAKSLLEAAGVPAPARRVVASAAEAAEAAAVLGFPVALKVDDRAIPHKAAAGCLALGLTGSQAVQNAYARLLSAAAAAIDRLPEQLVVEAQLPDGLDCFVGVLASEGLAPVLVLGLGGSLVECGLPAVAVRLPADAAGMRGAIGRWAGRAAVVGAEEALAEAAAAIGRLALACGSRLRALDVNPLRLITTPEGGRRVVALDALLDLSAPAGTARAKRS